MSGMTRTPMSDELIFFRGLFARPRNIGAIAPSSPALARAIAAQINPDVPGPVLELGPGTGVVTEALIARGLAPDRIIAIEYDPDFARLLASRFPGVTIINGDAFSLRQTLAHHEGPFAGIVSGLPLLNFPPAKRAGLIGEALDLLAPAAPFVQFSYGLHSPVTPPQGASVRQAAFVVMNLPPARVWVYERPPKAKTAE
jgi:phosphatidylethanolamine/phosphatidyl-N-methylethanolamine N-methyltransferase